MSRPLRTALVGTVALVAVIAAAALALAPPPHKACKNFRFSPAEWRVADGARRETLARLIVRCHTFNHKTRDVVYSALGGDRLSGVWDVGSSYTGLSYSQLQIRFGGDDRVRSVRVVTLTD